MYEYICSMKYLFLLLGTNLGKYKNNLNKAVFLLNENTGRINEVSSVYKTEPWDINLKTGFIIWF